MSDWKINHTELLHRLEEADKVSENLIRRTISNRLFTQIKDKTPFSESELRKLIRLALANYEHNNEFPLQKINMLVGEERQECLARIINQFRNIFDEILKDSPTKTKNGLNQNIENFFS